MTIRSFDPSALAAWSEAVLRQVDVRASYAESCARVLGAADLQGIDSHGIARLSSYVGMVDRGAVLPDGEPVVEHSGSTGTVDAHNILGPPAAELSMDLAVQLARDHGVGWVATRNSNHYGIAGYFAKMAATQGFIGLSGTNAGARVAPAGSAVPFLGTNPIAIAAPTSEEPMFVLDMATSAASTGKFEIAAREGRPIPLGFGVDSDGNATENPADLAQGGWLLPLGSSLELSSYKGSGLALGIEVLSALLVGGPYGPNVTNMMFSTGDNPPMVSHFFCALDPGRFTDPDTFADRMSALMADMRALPPTDPQRPVMTPGEPEWREEQRRREHGVPLVDPVVDDLTSLGERFGIPFVDPN